jgi:hypothetical protein
MASPANLTPPAGKLQKPLARLLRPLVSLLIRSGMTFPALCDLLRELYVNVAEHDFGLPGKEQTDSRVSLLTGIHRKEVSRLRGAGTPLAEVPASLSRTSLVLARWLGSPAFCDGEGRPLPLPRVAPSEEPSFERLVTSVTRDVRPRAVLDEWLDRKLVALQGEQVVLLAAALVPPPGDDQLLYYFGRNLHDHMAAAVSNISGGQPPFLERAVHYDGLPQAVAQRLQAKSRELALEALRAANTEATAACEGVEDGSWRWSFGLYVYAADDQGEGDAHPGADPAGAGPAR